MKISRSFIWLTLLLLAQKTAAQSIEGVQNFRHPGFSFSVAAPGVGFLTKSTKELAISLPDTPFRASGKSWNVMDVMYTFRNGWGLRLLFKKTTIRAFREHFQSGLEENFPGYFIQHISMKNLPLNIDQSFLGMTFTETRGRFLFQPALLFGFSKLNYRGAGANAKEEGTNKLYSLRFLSLLDKGKREKNPTVLAGCKVEYFLIRDLAVATSIDFTAIRHHLKYEYSRTDEIEQTIETEIISFKTWQMGASFQVGFLAFF